MAEEKKPLTLTEIETGLSNAFRKSKTWLDDGISGANERHQTITGLADVARTLVLVKRAKKDLGNDF